MVYGRHVLVDLHNNNVPATTKSITQRRLTLFLYFSCNVYIGCPTLQYKKDLLCKAFITLYILLVLIMYFKCNIPFKSANDKTNFFFQWQPIIHLYYPNKFLSCSMSYFKSNSLYNGMTMTVLYTGIQVVVK